MAFGLQMRYTDQQKLQQHQKHLTHEQVQKMQDRLRLIDTTLLKCYLKVMTAHVFLGHVLTLKKKQL